MLGERIKELRGGLSKNAFSKRFRVHINTLINYETGYRTPKADFLQALCEEYNVQPNWLLLGKGQKHWGEEGKPTSSAADQGALSDLTDLGEWLEELCEEEPERKSWFKMELIDKFPLFKAWLKKRNQARAESNNRRAA